MHDTGSNFNSAGNPYLMKYLPVFAYTLSITPEMLRSGEGPGQIVEDINQQLSLANQLLLNEEDENLCRFAVCAWVDETILNLPDNGFVALKVIWQKSLLQKKHFNTVNAGQLFYETLNRLDNDRHHVLEIFYFCLSLGYRGKFPEKQDSVLLKAVQMAMCACLGKYYAARVPGGCSDYTSTKRVSVNPGKPPGLWQTTRPLYVYFMMIFSFILLMFFLGIFLVLDTRLEYLLQKISS